MLALQRNRPESTQGRNSSQIPFQWMTQMPLLDFRKLYETVEAECTNAMALWGYVLRRSSTHTISVMLT